MHIPDAAAQKLPSKSSAQALPGSVAVGGLIDASSFVCSCHGYRLSLLHKSFNNGFKHPGGYAGGMLRA